MARLDVQASGVRTRADAPSVQPTNILETLATYTPGVPSSLKGCVFGPPKTKKTTLACSGGRTLLVNFDPEGYATSSLRGRTDITVVEPANFLETDALVRAIINGEAKDYDFIVIDTVTFMFQLFGGHDITSTYMEGRDIRRAYGKAGAAVSQIVGDLALHRKSNVIFVAHLMKEFDDGSDQIEEDLGEYEVMVAVTPMVWKVLGGAVGFIGRTYKELTSDLDTRNNETKFFVSFNDGSRSPAGSRYEMEARYEVTDTLLSDLATAVRR